MSATLKLPASFYQRNTLTVARELLGCFLVRRWRGRRLIGRITEVEAYAGLDDRASHASHGKTARNAVMFASGGTIYVYLIYGMYHCLNIVTEQKEYPAAVLIRTVEPVSGILGNTDGPGKLCRAMHITRTMNGKKITGRELWIEKGKHVSASLVSRSKRIGVEYAGKSKDWPWRFSLGK